MAQQIYVYENWTGKDARRLGVLHVESGRASEHFSFEYDKDWLATANHGLLLDPDLPFFRGRQFTPSGKTIFGLFSDSCPDRWGRVLMKRREQFAAKKEGRKPRNLLESDYLLGVYDETRMGGLRFCLEDGGPFLSDDKEQAAPPWATLRTLEFASMEYEKDEGVVTDKWLKQLIKPGSSLGGARPKATVQDTDGSLWIAKFPSKSDEWNTGAWEKVVHDLARECGLDVPESRIENLSKNGSTFLVKRFDRNKERRIHFASAMTLLGKTDGASGTDGSSYLDIVAFIRSNSIMPKHDLKELWSRIVFNMAVSNTDDHLRNHGFILDDNGWKLSPLYDVNPVPYGDSLALNVDEVDASISLELVLATAEYFDLDEKEAERIAANILKTVKDNWESKATAYSLSRGAIEHMRPAFTLAMEA